MDGCVNNPENFSVTIIGGGGGNGWYIYILPLTNEELDSYEYVKVCYIC